MRHALSASLDGNIIIWDLAKNLLLNKKSMHNNGIYALTSLGNSLKYVSTGADN